MKKFILVSFIGFASSIAQASYTMCANSELYYSSTRVDMGIQPPPGTKTGSLTIMFQGKTLVSEVFESGLGRYKASEYTVEVADSKRMLEQTGNKAKGSITYKSKAKLMQIDQINPSKQTLLAEQNVVCVETWAIVP